MAPRLTAAFKLAPISISVMAVTFWVLVDADGRGAKRRLRLLWIQEGERTLDLQKVKPGHHLGRRPPALARTSASYGVNELGRQLSASYSIS